MTTLKNKIKKLNQSLSLEMTNPSVLSADGSITRKQNEMTHVISQSKGMEERFSLSTHQRL